MDHDAFLPWGVQLLSSQGLGHLKMRNTVMAVLGVYRLGITSFKLGIVVCGSRRWSEARGS